MLTEKHNLLRKVLLWLGGWGLVSLFFSSRAYVPSSGMGEMSESFAEVLRQSATQWYAWGMLSLAIIWLDRKFARGASLARRLTLHVPLSFVITLVYFVLTALLESLLQSDFSVGHMRDPMVSALSLRGLLGGAFQWNYLVYWVIAGGWLAWDFYRESAERRIEAAELALKTSQLEQSLTASRLLNLKSQLHPHFLFNALNTISAFVESDPRTARRMIEHLGDLLRFSLEQSETQETTLEAELQALNYYLAIQRMRFDDRLRVDLNIAPETLPAIVPSLILQPLVENVIQHAVAHATRPVNLTIQAEKRSEQLRLEIRDDGPGLPAQWNAAQQAGIGLSNTRQRLAQLYPGAHDFTLKNGTVGAHAEITLPFRT